MQQVVTSKRCIILFVIILAQTLANFSNLIFSARAIDVMQQFSMTEVQLSMVTTAGMLPGVILSIFIGHFMDKKGMKNIIAVGLALTAALMIWRIFADTYAQLLLITLVLGASLLPFNVGAAKMLGVWFPAAEMPLAVGFFGSAAGLGTTLAFFLANLFPTFTTALSSIGIASVIVLLLWVILVKERPEGATGAAMPAFPKTPKNAFRLVLKSPNVWKITILSGLAIGTALLINIYMVQALVIQKGLSEVGSGFTTGLLNICLLAGSAISAIVVKKIALINVSHAFCCIGGGIIYAFAWFLPFGTQTYILIALAGLIVAGSIGINTTRVPLLPLTREFGMECVATANGVVATGTAILAFLVPTVVSAIAKGNFNLVFIINTSLCILVGLVSLTIPELGEKGKLAKAAREEAIGANKQAIT